MRPQKIIILFAFVFGMTVSAISYAFDWFGKEQNEKPASPAANVAQEKVVSKKAETAKTPAAAVPAAPAQDVGAQNLSALTNRMANNKSMSDAEKSQLATTALKYFSAGVDLQAKEYEQDMLYFEQVANDPNMKVAEKMTSLETYFSAPRVAPSAQPQAVTVAAPAVAPAVVPMKSIIPVKVEQPKKVIKEVQEPSKIPAEIKAEPQPEVSAKEVAPKTVESKPAANSEPAKVKKRANNFA